jgi:hypothetical protein
MHTAGRPLISSIAGGIGGTTLALVGAPWWLTAVAFGCFALGLVVVAIEGVFPQESAHRLAWWRDRRRHQQLRRQGMSHDQGQARRPGGGYMAETSRPRNGASGRDE